MAKCGSPEIKSPGTMSLWVYLTIVYEGMLGSFCMELQQFVLSHLCGKVSLRFHDTSSLSFICTSPAWCTWCSMLSNSAVFRTACPGAWELQIAHLRLPGLQSVPSALDTFLQTCYPVRQLHLPHATVLQGALKIHSIPGQMSTWCLLCPLPCSAAPCFMPVTSSYGSSVYHHHTFILSLCFKLFWTLFPFLF